MSKKSKPKITNVLPAGPNHQVITVVGGDKRYCTQPCAQCPWRKDQAGSFPASAFKHSANTAYNLSTHTFACHMAGTEKPAICAGFLLKGSYHNMSIRLAIIKGDVKVDDVKDGGHKLFDNYVEMAMANGVRRSDPVLRPCRT